eukprot:c14950_g1_i1 orf=306-1520(+)
MEGVGDGYKAFVQRLQMGIAPSNMVKNSNQRMGPHPPPAQHEQFAKYVGYPSPTNAFTVKREDSSARTTCSTSVEISMQDAVSSSVTAGASASLRNANPVQHFSSDVSQMPDAPPRRGEHRRAQSEIAFRLPDDLLFEHELGFSAAEVSTHSDGIGEDLVSLYFDVGKTNSSGGQSKSCVDGTPLSYHSRSLSVDGVLAGFGSGRGGAGVIVGPSDAPRPRHRHSNSMDGSTSFKQDFLTSDVDSLESKKAVAAKKLAELALIDPKRAKRILANRQSAARSKERKMRYISELENKVLTLQTEATALSAQLTMLQRDTAGLTTENSELKLRVQSMEQDVHLRDALSDALREEVQRLKLATGQLASANGHSFKLETWPFFQLPQISQHLSAELLHPVQTSLSNHHQ